MTERKLTLYELERAAIEAQQARHASNQEYWSTPSHKRATLEAPADCASYNGLVIRAFPPKHPGAGYRFLYVLHGKVVRRDAAKRYLGG